MSNQNPFAGAQAGASGNLDSFMSNNAGALGGIGGGLLGLFGNSQMQNPASAGMGYLQNLPPQLQAIFAPYMQGGQGAMQGLQGQFNGLNGLQNPLMGQISQMMSNPGQYMNQIGSNYQQSPGYNFQVQQALKAANQASAAGGMAGSPMEQQQIAGTVNQLANQDYYNYLSNALGVQRTGLEGAQNLYGQGLQGQMGLAGLGAGAANQYASGLGNIGNSMANTAALQAQYNNQQQGSSLGDIGSIIGGLASFL